jgi:transposase
MTKTKPRNWAQYNRKLKQGASVELWFCADMLLNWGYTGVRKRGGVQRYSDQVIELCHTIRGVFKLALRQTQGFIQSLLQRLNVTLKVPDYTTMSRRLGKMDVKIKPYHINLSEPIVIAVDATGLSVFSASAWHRTKHKTTLHTHNQTWRKLHICIDVETGQILTAGYSSATTNDCLKLPELLADVSNPIAAVCADMAYDTINCRKAVLERAAQQRIPPKHNARISTTQYGKKSNNHNILNERNAAIECIHQTTQNQDISAARSAWKHAIGYHKRSRIEASMWQIKAHTTDVLRNKRETNRKNEAIIKCNIINTLLAA